MPREDGAGPMRLEVLAAGGGRRMRGLRERLDRATWMADTNASLAESCRERLAAAEQEHRRCVAEYESLVAEAQADADRVAAAQEDARRQVGHLHDVQREYDRLYARGERLAAALRDFKEHVAEAREVLLTGDEEIRDTVPDVLYQLVVSADAALRAARAGAAADEEVLRG